MTQSIAAPAAEDRFSRFRLIGWWDQEKIRAARVLVIGAGALGNGTWDGAKPMPLPRQ